MEAPTLIQTENLSTWEDKKIPVTVVVGFLGCGKTTFIDRLARQVHNKRVAILQNDFSAEMGIEMPQLLKTGADVFELPNGCLCCSTKDGLVVAIEKILACKTRFDWLVIEAAGTADPVDLTAAFWTDYQLDSPLVLDGVLAITDANILNKIFGNDHAEPELVQLASKQLSVADVVLVNKTDIAPITSDNLQQLENLLGNTSKIIQTSYCQVDLDKVMGLDMFSASKLLTANFQCSRGCTIDSHDHSVTHCVPHQHDPKTQWLKSYFIKTVGVYSLDEFNRAISHILWELPAPVYRAKADCDSIAKTTHETIATFQLQGVGKTFEITPIQVEEPPSENRLVFVGGNLVLDKIEKLTLVNTDDSNH